MSNHFDNVWANDPATSTPLPPNSLWFSTLVDIATQWGWLFLVIILGFLFTAAFGEHRPGEER